MREISGRQRQVLATLSEIVRARTARHVLQQASVRAEYWRSDSHLAAAVLCPVRSTVGRCKLHRSRHQQPNIVRFSGRKCVDRHRNTQGEKVDLCH